MSDAIVGASATLLALALILPAQFSDWIPTKEIRGVLVFYWFCAWEFSLAAIFALFSTEIGAVFFACGLLGLLELLRQVQKPYDYEVERASAIVAEELASEDEIYARMAELATEYGAERGGF